MDRQDMERRVGAADVVVWLRELLVDERHAAARLARQRLDPAPAASLTFAIAGGNRRATPTDTARVRHLSAQQRTAICYRDGFIDRLSPQRWRLVYPGALHLLARELAPSLRG